MLWLNIVLPGAGLLLSGRLLSGGLCLLLAMISIAVLLLSHVIAVDAFALRLLWQSLGAYAALSLVSSLWLWWRSRKPRWDAQQLRQLHRDASRAYLCGNQEQALTAARHLTRLAGDVIGSWQLLAIIADTQGDTGLARRARQRALAIHNEEI